MSVPSSPGTVPAPSRGITVASTSPPPIAPSAGSNAPSAAARPDVAVTGWAALTVRVAWTLLAEGVRVRPTVLRDARDHVLFHLDPSMPLGAAEDRAGELVVRFVARARRKPVQDPWPQDASMPLSPRWRRALDKSLTTLTGALFRLHYGDGRSLETVERMLQIDRIALEAARGGLREVLRTAGAQDGLPFDQWPNARLDRLLRRLAAWSPGPCPPVLEVVEGRHREHLASCCRCDRAFRLVRNDVLGPADLVAPAAGARPQGTVEVVAVHFHPDGRHHRDVVAREIAEGVPCFPVGDDLLFVDLARPEVVRDLLVLAAEVGAPARDHLRGAALTGPGRWSAHGLLGPLVERAELEVRSRSWATVDRVGDLPEVLPDPPPARRWWTFVGALGLLGASITAFAVAPAGEKVDHPLEVQFTEGRGGVWTAFDVDDDATVTLIRRVDGGLDVVEPAAGPVDKAPWATGDGGYRVHTMGDGVLLVSSTGPVADLGEMVAAASKTADPLDDLAARIGAADVHADVRTWRR